MEINIYQINLDRDRDGLAFISHDLVNAKQGSPDINPQLYDKVFSGEVTADTLEDIYRIFNLEHPEGYAGRSLSVSDIVEVIDSEQVAPGAYYCDSIGFKEVAFDASQIPENMKPEKITVVMVEPGKLARVAEIGTSLEELQKTVGGWIEAYYPFEEQVCIVCNDEGKINHMDLNRAIRGEDGEIVDIIAGPFFICDCSTDRFGSLSKEQQEKYLNQYRQPERFYRFGGEIAAIPFEPNKESRER